MSGIYKRFLLITFLLNLLCLYYSTVFCTIYSSSTKGWIQGGIIGVFLDVFVISVTIPLIKSSIRILIRNFKILKFLIIDYSFFLLNYVL